MTVNIVLLSCIAEVSFVGGRTERRNAGGGNSTSAGETSVELDDPLLILPWLVEAILDNLFPLVAHGRQQLVSASGRPELQSGVRLLARLSQPRESGCRFHIRFLIFLTRNDGSLGAIDTNDRLPHTIPIKITAGDSVNDWTWTHTSRSYSYADASSVVWVVPLAVWIIGGSFDFLIVSCPSEVPESTNEFINSLSFSHRRWRNTRGTQFDQYMFLLRISTWTWVYTFLCSVQNWRSCYVFHVHGPFDGSFTTCWTVWSRWFSDHVWMTPSASPNLIFQNILVPEMMEFHSELSLIIRLYLLPLQLVFIIRRNVTCNSYRLFFPNQV